MFIFYLKQNRQCCLVGTLSTSSILRGSRTRLREHKGPRGLALKEGNCGSYMNDESALHAQVRKVVAEYSLDQMCEYVLKHADEQLLQFQSLVTFPCG